MFSQRPTEQAAAPTNVDLWINDETETSRIHLTRIFSAFREKTDLQGGLLPSSHSGSSSCKTEDSRRARIHLEDVVYVAESKKLENNFTLKNNWIEPFLNQQGSTAEFIFFVLSFRVYKHQNHCTSMCTKCMFR